VSALSSQCTARSKRSGVQCKRLVLGGGVCAMHGGKAPQVAAKRLERIAWMRAGQAAGLEQRPDVTPEEALLEELHRTVGRVRQLEVYLQTHDTDADEGRTLQLFMAERGHVRQVAETALRTNAVGKQVQLSERQGALIVLVMRAILARVGIDPADPAVVAIVREELQRIQQMESQLEAQARVRPEVGR
jgi:hypothetical protein